VSKKNTFIYVKGLPDDVTMAEAKEFFEKAGIIRVDLHSGEAKIKIYLDSKGIPKGDALISYAKEESIDLAMDILNGRDFRPGKKITIEKA
jgi:HIV Tat-specific factor 1